MITFFQQNEVDVSRSIDLATVSSQVNDWRLCILKMPLLKRVNDIKCDYALIMHYQSISYLICSINYGKNNGRCRNTVVLELDRRGTEQWQMHEGWNNTILNFLGERKPFSRWKVLFCELKQVISNSNSRLLLSTTDRGDATKTKAMMQYLRRVCEVPQKTCISPEDRVFHW